MVPLRAKHRIYLPALTGVVLLALVTNILTLSDISSTWIDAVDGAIILIALGLAKLIGSERK
jgi:simple sugar transport system permease protein